MKSRYLMSLLSGGSNAFRADGYRKAVPGLRSLGATSRIIKKKRKNILKKIVSDTDEKSRCA